MPPSVCMKIDNQVSATLQTCRTVHVNKFLHHIHFFSAPLTYIVSSLAISLQILSVSASKSLIKTTLQSFPGSPLAKILLKFQLTRIAVRDELCTTDEPCKRSESIG